MRSIGKKLAVVAILGLLTPLALAGSDDTWLHIRVEESGRRGETVNINLPFKMIEALLPMIDTGDCGHPGDHIWISDGKLRIDTMHWTEMDLKSLWEVVRDAEDAEYVTVEGRHETVRVAKEKDHLVVKVDDRDEKVDIKLKLAVVKAMLTGDSDELDLVAAVKELRKQGAGELVSVVSDDEHVRIWIDSESTGR